MPTERLIGTVGVSTSGAFSSAWPVELSDANMLLMSPGGLLVATVLLPTKEATISAVRAQQVRAVGYVCHGIILRLKMIPHSMIVNRTDFK